MTFLDDLNPEQREAVMYTDGPSLVIAGAGSGKTRVLTYKIAYLLTLGIPAYRILALTFTNKAAREMKERIAKLVGEDTARHLWMGTFHSVFTHILRHEIANLPAYTKDFSIYDSADSKSVIKHILSDWGLEEKTYKVSTVLNRISMAKNRLQSPQAYSADAECRENDRAARLMRMPDIYMEYVRRLRNANAMDFDDLLVNMHILLQTSPETLKKYQELFEFILVDEYQDTNFAQYTIIRELTQLKNKLCVVGDDAQSIYSFRGANIQNILSFQRDNGQARLFRLERNYRSTQNIVNAANSLISKNNGQIPKHVYSEKEVGDKLLLSSHENDRDEAAFIARTIARIHRTEQIPYDEIAVMYRTNSQSRVLEDEMRKLGLAYRIYGGTAFYQRKEIKDAIAYMKLAINPQDEEALIRIINTPARGIGDTTVRKVLNCAHEKGISPFAVAADPLGTELDVSNATKERIHKFATMVALWGAKADTTDAYELAQEIMNQSELIADAKRDKTEDGINRAENLEEFLASIHEYREERLKAGETTASLSDFLSEVSLLTDQDKAENDGRPRITLLTIHAAKGLEYEIVFLPGLEEGLFPSSYVETSAEMEEERRLLYVGITRAKRVCYICSALTRWRNGQIVSSAPSRFIKDIDSAYLMKEITASSATPRWSNHNMWNNPKRNQWEIPSPAVTKAPKASVLPVGSKLKRISASASGEKKAITTSYPIQSRVRHKLFGDGTVLETFTENGNEKIAILFDEVGKKELLLTYAKLEKI